MPRERSAKSRAARLDPQYLRRRWRGGLSHWRGGSIPFRWWRRALVTLVCAGAAVWAAVGFGRNPVVHNPGAVTAAHAMWANDCAACHDGGPGGRFSRSVSDRACLTCHEAPAHHPHQARFVDAAAGGTTAANCASCHVEHRGRVSLAAVSDHYCTQCHADLRANTTREGEPDVAESITAFAAGAHPEFGASIPTTDDPYTPQWSDPTRLKFNHKFHFDNTDLRHKDCTVCHKTRGGDEGSSPVLTSSGAGGAPPESRGGGYMQPIVFEEHCAKTCHTHKLELTAGVTLPHDRMEVVRGQIYSLHLPYLDKAASQKPPPPDPAVWAGKQFESLVKKLDAGGAEFKTRRKAIEAALAEKSEPPLKGKALREMTKKGWPVAVPGPAGDALEIPNPQLIENYVFFRKGNGCIVCHDQAGVSTATARRPAARPPPPPEPRTLETVPTGIPAAVRRWFVNGRFDHRSHRALACVDCHAGALSSGDKTATATADVLLPTIESCTTCHHSGTDRPGTVATACVTCHDYHNSRLEAWPHGHATNPIVRGWPNATTRPAAPPREVAPAPAGVSPAAPGQ